MWELHELYSDSRYYIVCLYRGKDTLLSKRNSVVVKEHQFEFVTNNRIIVDHWKLQTAQTYGN